MTRTEFMQELERLLFGISEEERKEAIEFYENYFEEAGKDKEDEVIKELGSPEEVAESIKKSLEYGSTDTGYFAEDGYHEGYKEKANLPSFERHFTGEENRDRSSRNAFSGQERNDNNNREAERNNSTYREEERKDSSYAPDERKPKKRPMNTFLFILLIIFALPVVLPLVITVLSLLFAAVVTVAAVWISFAAVAVSLVFAGIALAVIGIIQLSVTPALGLSVIGGGFIVLGLGILFTIAAVWIAGKAMPAVIGWAKQILGKIFQRRRAYA